jgi:hypothetical protein
MFYWALWCDEFFCRAFVFLSIQMNVYVDVFAINKCHGEKSDRSQIRMSQITNICLPNPHSNISHLYASVFGNCSTCSFFP